MAVAFLSSTATYCTAHHLASSSSIPSPSSSSSSSSPPPSSVIRRSKTVQSPQLSKAVLKESSRSSPATTPNHPIFLTKRQLALGLTAGSFLLSFTGIKNDGSFSNTNNRANAAILEADEDDELMERIKKDRQKRIERQGFINSSKKETGYLQQLVYKLSEVGRAIERNDLNAASSVLGPTTDTDWIKKANSAFTKLSSGPEENAEVDTFNTSMANLISSVGQKNVESSKIAFVDLASALEKWALLSGLGEQLKGL